MTKKILLLACLLSHYLPGHSQNIGIGTTTPDASAQLDISTTTKGLLIPRMSTASITSISNPAKGLMVYDSIKNQLVVNMGTPATPDWQSIVARSGWALTGNSGTNPTTDFIGTSDTSALVFRINNQPAGKVDSATSNTFLGYGAGKNNTGGTINTGFGYQALSLNDTGNYNTAFGVQALYMGTNRGSVGDYNTATGYQAMNTGYSIWNTATGYQALFINKGQYNTATGYQALYTGGGNLNTATGAQALFYSTSAYSNTATGVQALYGNYTGSYNTATGYHAMRDNSNGSYNTATGGEALGHNLSGNFNTAFGYQAIITNIYGSQNTAVGFAGLHQTTGSDGNTAIGYNAGASYDNGYYNCFIGSETDATGPGFYNTIALGHGTLVTAPNMMRVGNTATTSIGGPVGWSVISDGRVKKNIRENVPGLAFITKLRPISYNIDVAAIDRIVRPRHAASPKLAAAMKAKEQIVYTGFVAQEVEQAARSLNYDFSGVDAAKNDKDLYSLRYADFVVPLVKAVQELAARNDRLQTDNQLLKKQKDQLLQRLDALEKKIH